MSMADHGAGFLSSEWQHSTVNVGGALASIYRRLFPRDTAKRVSAALDCDQTAAVNFTKGHASERTITKALKTGGWPVILQLGEAMTGQSYDDYLQSIIQEAENARAYAAARADRVRSLEARAAELVSFHPRPSTGKAGSRSDGLGSPET